MLARIKPILVINNETKKDEKEPPEGLLVDTATEIRNLIKRLKDSRIKLAYAIDRCEL